MAPVVVSKTQGCAEQWPSFDGGSSAQRAVVQRKNGHGINAFVSLARNCGAVSESNGFQADSDNANFSPVFRNAQREFNTPATDPFLPAGYVSCAGSC